jgi:hypothetical protein
VPRPSGAGATRQPLSSRGIGDGRTASSRVWGTCMRRSLNVGIDGVVALEATLSCTARDVVAL